MKVTALSDFDLGDSFENPGIFSSREACLIGVAVFKSFATERALKEAALTSDTKTEDPLLLYLNTLL